MGSKMNMTFFKAYIELDKACAQRLEVEKHGVSAYIANLVEMRFAPGRNETLPRLIKYRKLRNAMAHEENAFDDIEEINKSDVQWITRFTNTVNKKRDPVSRYMRKEWFFNIWKKIRLVIYLILGSAVAYALYLIFSYFAKK